jgi:hypothetical protein
MALNSIAPSSLPAPAVRGGNAPLGPTTAAYQPNYASQPVRSQSMDWNSMNPHQHIFDYPYDAWKMNSFPMQLGGIGFWCGGPLRRAFTSMVTGIPNDRLNALAVRDKFMSLPGMRPDWARVLQVAYANHTQGQMPLKAGSWPNQVDGPDSWLAGYGAPGGIYDWTLRGPLEIELQTGAVQMMMATGFRPDVPGAGSLQQMAAWAATKAPPLPPGSYGGQQNYGGQPMYGQPYGYGGDPIGQIGGLINQIGNIFR